MTPISPIARTTCQHAGDRRRLLHELTCATPEEIAEIMARVHALAGRMRPRQREEFLAVAEDIVAEGRS